MPKTAFSEWVALSLRLVRHICGVALVLTAFSGTAYAPPKKPEIDPGSMKSALVLLGGGLLLMRDCFRRHSR